MHNRYFFYFKNNINTGCASVLSLFTRAAIPPTHLNNLTRTLHHFGTSRAVLKRSINLKYLVF